MKTITDLLNKMKHTSQEFAILYANAPDYAGNTALNYIKHNFDEDKEGFDNGAEKWKPKSEKTLKSYKNLKANFGTIKADAKRQMFYSGDLFNSLKYVAEGRNVWVGIDPSNDKVLKYAKVHNEGGRAGRGKGFQLPQRKFLGWSEGLKVKIRESLLGRFNRLMKKELK